MQPASYRTSRGFSIFELIIAMGLATVVLGGALALTSQAIGISDLVSQRSDMQQNGRVAMNMMALDASLAGTGFPTSGIQLPSGDGSGDSHFACDQATGCHITNNVYTDERLYATWPGQAGGPTINGIATDVLTVVYDDPNSNFNQYILTDIDAEGKKIWFNPATTPAYNDAVFGLQQGDVLLTNNGNGQSVVTVTSIQVNEEVRLTTGASDPLDFNQQSGAAFGTFKSTLHPPAPALFADTTVRRIFIVTYYIDDSNPDVPLLMRQVNGHPPTPVAEYVENLQITYDIYDENTAIATADLNDAGGQPNQIRKTNITITVRSPKTTLIEKDFQRITLATSVGPRNLTYKDRYE